MKLVKAATKQVHSLNANTGSKPQRMDANITITQVQAAETYTGEYDVVPKVGKDIILSTENKMMKKDVTVREVPIRKTATAGGGVTMFIGKGVVLNG